MKKAKTNNKIITILSAILGVVFAFTMGVTYCVTSLNLIFGTKPESTTAYLGNQQYHIVNDTLENPILFGEGSHNFEIALQYAFDYSFDVRLKYEMLWSVGVKQTDQSYNKKATNVILNFANRDNIIYDEEYIYLANSVSAGNGKLTFITGIDFVDTQDATYFGQTLKINITEIKIYKSQTSYTDSHILMKKTVVDDETQEETLEPITTPAAQAWLYNKQKATSATSYVMMYNYRRNYANGIPYPGLETAYKKPVDSSTVVSGPAWAGGNRAYAGTGMYVITGTSAVKMKIEVAGIWRDSNGAMDEEVISENSIQYNYTNDWTHSSWDSARLWEIRAFSYVIPARSSCYIDILDSIEIVSAGRIQPISYDSYRLVTNRITINPGLEDASGNSLKTEFEYTESNSSFIKIGTIHSNSNVSASTNYSQKNIDVVNTSIYSNGLYTANASSASEQSFNTNVSLINNTAEIKTVTVNYQLWYHISNAQTNLANKITENDVTTYKRAEEYVEDKTYTNAQAFASNLYFTNNVQATAQLSSTMTTSVTIAPYSSVNVAEGYKVASGLQSSVASTYDTNANDGKTDYFDVWTYLVVTATEVTTENEANLAIESTLNGGSISLSVKNNTNKTITGVLIDDVSVKEMGNASYQALNTQPSDWTASYWKYYTRSGTEGAYVYTQLTSDPITAQNPFAANTYFEKLQAFSEKSLTVPTGFTKLGSSIYNPSLVLQPGETAVFATAIKSSTANIMISGIATASYVMEIETKVSGTSVLYRVTNNSSKTINGITIRSFSVKDNNTSDEISYNLATGFTKSGDFITNSTLSLAAGESYDFASSTITEGVTLKLQGIAMSILMEDSNSIMLINNGKSSAYIVNNSNSSYYIRFSGTYTGTDANIFKTTNYNYFIGIVRPGQILTVPMSTSGTFSATVATDNYSASTLSTAGWEASAIALMTKYFALVK